jgi:hypothetical protein
LHLLALLIAGSHFHKVDLFQPPSLQAGQDCWYDRASSNHHSKCLGAQLPRTKLSQGIAPQIVIAGIRRSA